MRVVLPLIPRRIRWLGVIAVAGFVFYTSVLTAPPEVAVADQGDTGAFDILADFSGFAQAQWRHFFAYATLTGALAYATDHWGMDLWTRALAVIGIVTLFGLGIEVIQPLADRQFSVGDIVANTLGAVLVVPWFLLRPSIELRPVRDMVWSE